jgi:hypothetical protein
VDIVGFWIFFPTLPFHTQQKLSKQFGCFFRVRDCVVWFKEEKFNNRKVREDNWTQVHTRKRNDRMIIMILIFIVQYYWAQQRVSILLSSRYANNYNFEKYLIYRVWEGGGGLKELKRNSSIAGDARTSDSALKLNSLRVYNLLQVYTSQNGIQS